MPPVLPLIANPLPRVLAAALDSLITSAIIAFSWAAFGASFEVAVGIWWAYNAITLISSNGSSPGKAVARIRVANASSYAAISGAQATVRAAVRPAMFYVASLVVFSLPLRVLSVEGSVLAVLLITFGIDMALLFRLPARQVLSDAIAKTVVIYTPLPEQQLQEVAQRDRPHAAV